MMKRNQVQAIVLMAAGALGGYAAATGQISVMRQAQAASRQGELLPAAEPGPTCWPDGTDRGLLAVAGGHEACATG